jgi:hypothetical protein
MRYTRLVPNIFYEDIKAGLKLFVDCLGFDIGYDELEAPEPFCVVQKDGLAAHLVQSKEFAVKDRPELRLETDDIDSVFDKIINSYPELLHPNSNKVSLKPWNAREFALRDESGVCIIIQQWNIKN